MESQKRTQTSNKIFRKNQKHACRDGSGKQGALTRKVIITPL